MIALAIYNLTIIVNHYIAWHPSIAVTSFLFGLCVPFVMFAFFLFIALLVYFIYYYIGKEQTGSLINKYSLYELSDNYIFIIIGEKLKWVRDNILFFYKTFPFSFLIIWVFPLLLFGAPIYLLFGDDSWKEKVKGSLYMFAIGAMGLVFIIGFGVVFSYEAFIAFVTISPLLLYLSLKIVEWAINNHLSILKKTFPQSFNTCRTDYDLDDKMGILSITQATFKKTEELYQELTKEVSQNIKKYPQRSAKILGDLKEQTLLYGLSWNLDKAKLIADIPNEIKREEIARNVHNELTAQYPYGYGIWQFINKTKVTFKTIEHAKKWSPICEERIRNNDFSFYSKLYLLHGFTLTTINGIESDKQSWKKDVIHINNTNALSKTPFDNCTGVGVILGEKSCIRALDFDHLNTYISSDIRAVLNGEEQNGYLQSFLQEVFNMLGLPIDYPWVVISGSHKGIHILFNCKELNNTLSISSCSFQEPNNNYYMFERVELRWKSHLVLPPSSHNSISDGIHNRYVFINGKLPLQSPSDVSIHNINSYLTEKCSSLIVVDNYHCVSTKLPLALLYRRLEYSHTSSGAFTSLTIENGEYVEWLKACNDADALNTLGVYYSLGWGVEGDMVIARDYFEKADSDVSRFNLAMLISCGCLEGTRNDIKSYMNNINQDDVWIIKEYKQMIETNVSQRFNYSDSSFSDEQISVIKIDNGRHLVLAPPGCGKTRVLAERVMHAIDNGIQVEDMLCLTFTNRAAREMKERIDKRVESEDIERLFVGNVHHFCSSLLRENKVIAQKTTIIDDEEKNVVISEIIKNKYGISPTNVDDYYYFQHYLYQRDNYYPAEFIVKPEMEKYLEDERYLRVAREYLSYKKRYDLIDFEDLLLYGYDYLVNHQNDVKRYSWIQVDEVQDLNRLQLAIIEMVTAHETPCAVYLGDEQQAIYSFMGAKLETLKYLKDQCQGNIHHFLGNYRSPKYLLDVYNKYAEVNLDVDKDLLPQAQGENADMAMPQDGLLIESCEQREGFNKWDYCALDMAVDRAIAYPDGRTAILTYSNKDSDKISERLERKGVEHFKIAGTDFLWTKEVKLIFSHLNVFTQPENIMSWARILQGIGVCKMMEEAHQLISEANNASLRGNDLLDDARHQMIKKFVYDCAQEYVIFDTETTGLDVNQDDIVEIAAIRIRNGVIDAEFDIMLYTEKTIPPMLGETKNPLPEEYAKREKLNRKEGLQTFLVWVGDLPVLAHNVKYDYQILDANLKRDCGISDLDKRWERVHDSLAITRVIEPNLHSYKLKDLLTTFALQGKNSHLAIDDVKATKSLVDYCHRKASMVFVLQNDFFSKYKEAITRIKELYGELYSHTKSLLQQKSADGERNLLASEMEYAYHYFKDKEMIDELPKMKYLMPFLSEDYIPQNEDLTLQQLLDKYMIELMTLRESDLCESKSMKNKVKIYVSTIHRAKGLEFENVVVFDVRDGFFPFFEWNQLFNRTFDPAERERALKGMQEDARKLYVAISRAKKRLCIQYPHNNTGHGKNGWYEWPAMESPFMACIKHLFITLDKLKE